MCFGDDRDGSLLRPDQMQARPVLHGRQRARGGRDCIRDLLVKFYVDNDTDIGHFINEKVQVLPGIQDTLTIITFKAFGTG